MNFKIVNEHGNLQSRISLFNHESLKLMTILIIAEYPDGNVDKSFILLNKDQCLELIHNIMVIMDISGFEYNEFIDQVIKEKKNENRDFRFNRN